MGDDHKCLFCGFVESRTWSAGRQEHQPCDDCVSTSMRALRRWLAGRAVSQTQAREALRICEAAGLGERQFPTRARDRMEHRDQLAAAGTVTMAALIFGGLPMK